MLDIRNKTLYVNRAVQCWILDTKHCCKQHYKVLDFKYNTLDLPNDNSAGYYIYISAASVTKFSKRHCNEYEYWVSVILYIWWCKYCAPHRVIYKYLDVTQNFSTLHDLPIENWKTLQRANSNLILWTSFFWRSSAVQKVREQLRKESFKNSIR